MLSGLTMTGVVEALHIGLSGLLSPTERLGAVRVADVTATLAASTTTEDYAVRVVHPQHTVIRDCSFLRSGDMAGVGIFVGGVLGPMQSIRGNRVDHFGTGIKVSPLSGSAAVAQWVVADNLALGAHPVVDAPATVRQAGNVG